MPVSAEAIELERDTLAKVMRNMMVYIIVGQFFFQLVRTNIGFAQLTMGKEIALSATAFGFASGIFSLSSFFMQVPAFMLFEKFGAKRWLTFIMVAWGLVVVVQGFVTNTVELIIMRFLLGVFEAGFVPGLYILISLWFKGKDQGTATSGIQMGLALSGILGGPFAGWILGKTLFGLSGWRSLFVIEGAMTVIWALIALRIVNDSPEKASWLNTREREFMINYLAEYQAQRAANGAIEKASLWEALKDLRIVSLILSFTCVSWVVATFVFFTPILLKTVGKGLDNQTIGFLSMGTYIINALVAFTWGKHADKTERHYHCVMPLLVGVGGILLYPIATTPLPAMVCLAMVQAGTTGFFVNFWPTCNMLVGKKTMAKTTALINAGSQAGSFLAPIFFGWAQDATGKTNLGLYVCVGVLLLNFTVMNIFFFSYKTRLKKQAAGIPAS